MNPIANYAISSRFPCSKKAASRHSSSEKRYRTHLTPGSWKTTPRSGTKSALPAISTRPHNSAPSLRSAQTFVRFSKVRKGYCPRSPGRRADERNPLEACRRAGGRASMIQGLKPYREYKESGSKWLGTVPSRWDVRSMRTLITKRNGRNRADLPLLSVAREKGVFVRSLTDADENHNVIPDDLSNYKVVWAGDLVINKMKAWQGSMGIAPCDGIVSPAYFVYQFRIANRIYGHNLLRSRPYVAHFAQASDGVRIGQWDLSIPGMRQIPVLVPPPAEQAAIVRFLDWTNGRLERAIRAKRKVIALLNEQKQAIIHRAVTRGLDPSVPLKPSGIPWLGDIPQHWALTRIKNVF